MPEVGVDEDEFPQTHTHTAGVKRELLDTVKARKLAY